jgi:hypothetical protein
VKSRPNTRPRETLFHGANPAFVQQRLAQLDPIIMVQVENRDGGSAAGRQTDNTQAIPAEMIAPGIRPRMEQLNNRIGERIDASQIRTLLAVTFRARQREICQVIVAAMLRRYDVIDVER